MKLENAIEILAGLGNSQTAGVDEEEKEATQLGIEALKRVQDRRYNSWGSKRPLLPGETEE